MFVFVLLTVGPEAKKKKNQQKNNTQAKTSRKHRHTEWFKKKKTKKTHTQPANSIELTFSLKACMCVLGGGKKHFQPYILKDMCMILFLNIKAKSICFIKLNLC